MKSFEEFKELFINKYSYICVNTSVLEDAYNEINKYHNCSDEMKLNLASDYILSQELEEDIEL